LIPAFVFTVKAGGVGAEEPLHPLHEVSFGGLNHQVEMVAHQAPRMNRPFGLRTSLTERLEKQLAIFVTTEDRLPMVAGTEA
jgi:hypothetical protein